MNTIKEIKKPIQQEMLLFEKKFKDSLNSKVPLLDKILHYIVKRKGKQMRPMFVFL
ncbi:MAG TPA: polyprenyl synthetase, partial [Flavobacteriales bacterium]|nr:polyprenyl synthetase [Flavobacteriales bacterium]